MSTSLFESIGGRNTILTAVNAFYRRVLADDSLSHFFDNVDTDALRARQSMFLTMLLGGRVEDSNEQIRSAHAESRAAGLRDYHFDAMLIHFRAALQEAGVPRNDLEKIMAALETTRGAVLGR
jgi:hemoglobin